jgi:MerR HTH family regulatory protein
MPIIDLLSTAAAPPFSLREEDALVTKAEAARYLRVSTSTLERWERLDIGPKPIRLETGRVRYRWSELRKAAQGGGAA